MREALASRRGGARLGKGRRSGSVACALHVGHGEQKPGPLQAFNLSMPTWFDGVTQNEVMQTLRRLWLSKLSLIHEIKFSYGPGVGKPGPVDDWAKGGPKPGPDSTPSTKQVETDETGGFGTGFDPSEWA